MKGHKINTHTDSITTHMSAICAYKANNATRVMNLISVPLFTHMCARFIPQTHIIDDDMIGGCARLLLSPNTMLCE